MRAVGVDPSLTRLAVAVAGDVNETAVVVPKKGQRGIPRLVELRDQVREWIRRYRPSIIVMEGYSMAPRVGRLADLGELGGILKLTFYDEGFSEDDGTLVIVAPKQLKKFATGRGNADKAAVVVAVYKRWGVEVQTDDEADAYALARIGLGLLGEKEKLTQVQQDILQRLDVLPRSV